MVSHRPLTPGTPSGEASGEEGGRGVPRWEHFPHVADVGVRGMGGSPARALEQAALALSAVVCDPATVGAGEEVAFRCDAPDLELLLVDWLNALIHAMATRHLLFGRFDVGVEVVREGGEEVWRLTARARGEPVDRERHRVRVEVKAASYAALRVAEEAPGWWVAQCVVDV